MLIETSVLPFIQDWVCLSIDEVGFDISIKELGKVVVEGVRKRKNEVVHEINEAVSHADEDTPGNLDIFCARNSPEKLADCVDGDSLAMKEMDGLE